MAKAVALISALVCVLALANFAQCHVEEFIVQGEVYCDTCRVLFQTRISPRLERATVQLNCTNRETGALTYSVKGDTDENGIYRLPVKGDHAEDICEVTTKFFPSPSCMETSPAIGTVRVSLTENSGIKSLVRYVNPIGFTVEKAVPECAEVLDELGFVPLH